MYDCPKESDCVFHSGLKISLEFYIKDSFEYQNKSNKIFLLFHKLHLRTVGRRKYDVIAPKWDVCDKKDKRKNTEGIGINFVQERSMGISVYSTIIIKVTIIILSF